jgi:GNAT superfamily N-acetyltransferase
MTVTLRAARSADAPAVAAVFLAARREMRYLPVLHTDEDTGRFFATVVATRRVEVAEDPSGVIGFAAVHDGWLEHLYVRPGAQGAGVGGRLMAWAKEALPDGVDLWVFEPNTRARAFYAAHGLREVLRTDGSGNEERVPDVQMRWDPVAPTERRGDGAAR